jgi:MMP 1-O-methyltransferase
MTLPTPLAAARLAKRVLVRMPHRAPHRRALAVSALCTKWLTNEESYALVDSAMSLPHNAVIVEIGTWTGGSAVLLASACKARNTGLAHLVDPLDGSATDDYSLGVYTQMRSRRRRTIRHDLERNLRAAGVRPWVVVHQQGAVEAARDWTAPIDMLWFDGDQSRPGASAAWVAWAPHVKVGGVIAIHNSIDRDDYPAGQDGQHQLAKHRLVAPWCAEHVTVGTSTFARVVAPIPASLPGAHAA